MFALEPRVIIVDLILSTGNLVSSDREARGCVVTSDARDTWVASTSTYESYVILHVTAAIL